MDLPREFKERADCYGSWPQNIDDPTGPTVNLTYNVQHHAYEIKCAIFSMELASALHEVRELCSRKRKCSENKELEDFCTEIMDLTRDVDTKIGD